METPRPPSILTKLSTRACSPSVTISGKRTRMGSYHSTVAGRGTRGGRRGGHGAPPAKGPGVFAPLPRRFVGGGKKHGGVRNEARGGEGVLPEPATHRDALEQV